MKKYFVLFSTIFLILAGLTVSAKEVNYINANVGESYLILLKTPAMQVYSSNKGIITSEILTTLFNDKTEIIVNIIQEGNARIYINTEDELSIIEFQNNLTKTQEETKLKSKVIKNIIEMDKPLTKKETKFILDEPPPFKGKK